MKNLNKFYLLKRGILLGDQNYNYKIKSLLLQKLYSNYIYNYDQGFFFIKKAIELIVENSKNRNIILIYTPVKVLLKSSFSFKNIIFISDNWIPGSLSNLKTYKKYNTININKLPNLIILLNTSHLDNLDILVEASSFSIPVIMMLPNNLKFDNLYYPIIGNNSNHKFLDFYSVLFFNSILQGFFSEKFNQKYVFKA